ncbi:MAG TPA: AraC family transcriptional regulator [Archangium sp.]|uniref:AraC family transcriptional regulator n=1 Tax=Archangium sp. TaxID=1872627 RepID=UPI002E30F4CF|nr:AraC family transcriptional regulator [Archangium sp.]HEX5754328.1 AraC family transcriptional regulator [Archangium sp.]
MGMRRERRHRSSLVRAALLRVVQAGGGVEALLRDFELPRGVMTEHEWTMPLPRYREFLAACAEAARDPALGFHLATRLPRGYLGVFEMSAASAPNLEEAAARFVRYLRLLSEELEARLEQRGDAFALRQWIEGEPLGLGQHGNDFVTAAILRHAREFTGVHLEPLEVSFAHPRPADVSRLQDYFGRTLLRFDAGENTLVVRAEQMALPQMTFNPELLQVLDGHAHRLMASASEEAPDFLATVSARIRENLTHSQSLLPRVACALGLSPRTLQRRLVEHGSSFRELVEHVRKELALSSAAHRSVGELAFLLGYNERASFVRAFRRWTGTTVGEYRERHG